MRHQLIRKWPALRALVEWRQWARKEAKEYAEDMKVRILNGEFINENKKNDKA